jgi:hypothetical protein
MRVTLPLVTEPRFVVRVSELVLVPLINTDEWIRNRLAEGDFTSQRVDRLSTSCGWPVLVTFGMRDGVETLRVFFQFHDVGAFGEATGEDLEAAWQTLREARPDYDGEIAAISQLFT